MQHSIPPFPLSINVYQFYLGNLANSEISKAGIYLTLPNSTLVFTEPYCHSILNLMCKAGITKIGAMIKFREAIPINFQFSLLELEC